MSIATKITRVILHIFAILVLASSLGFVCAGIFTTAWQTYSEPGTGRRHQHGLWLDYILEKVHAGSGHELVWTWKYKFGGAVTGDEVHQAQSYQIDTLILLCVGVLLGTLGLLFSFCAPYSAFASVGWTMSAILAGVTSSAGVTLFYVTATSPENQFVYTRINRSAEHIIDYSFWLSVIGSAGYGVASLLSIVCNTMTVIAASSATANRSNNKAKLIKVISAASSSPYPRIPVAQNSIN